MVICIAPIRPVEFVILHIGWWDWGSKVEEV